MDGLEQDAPATMKKQLVLFQRLPIRPADFFLKPLIFGLFSSHG
jgi:hypothetical protein